MSSPFNRAKPLLGPADIEQAIHAIASKVASGQSVLLVGGVALYLYGSNRLTTDVDVAASAPLLDLSVGESLTFGGYTTHVRGVPVDVILRNDDYADVFEEALLYPRTLLGLPIPIASLEYILVMKLIANRGKAREDIQTIFGLEGFDLPRAQQLVRRLLGRYAAQELESMRLDAGWRRDR